MALIECVPNVSEGRRRRVVEAMATAIREVPGVAVLDHSSDTAHNRSVFTLAGRARDLPDAILALFDRAVADIDLRSHAGVHPRIGAVDVVPFVPLAGATMSECVILARETGAKVAARYGVPIYLYEEAASIPARRKLEDIRRGQFEGLAAKMANAAWRPDFGPVVPHPTAGATAIGARSLLIAYNVNLASDQLDVAKAVAAVVRERGGGLPAVKAMGVALESRSVVQVSMNLTDYRRTSMRAAFEAVARASARHGVAILDSEIVGLVPRDALSDTDPADLRIRGFTEDRILEHRLEQVTWTR
jgi:glutamate formiminotransferase